MNLKCCDCLSDEGICSLENSSIDMVLCDPPFGVLAREEWDKKLDLEILFRELKRVTKPNAAVVFFSSGIFTAELMMGPWKKWFRYDLIWEKNKPRGVLNSKKMPLRQHENILVFYRKLPKYSPQMREGFEPIHACKRKATSGHYGEGKGGKNEREGKTDRYPTSILKFSVVNKPIHPTEKPVPLLEFLIKSFTEEGATVMDMCFGSASTAEACIKTNRKFTGFEMNQEFYEKGRERIEALLV
uniref:DNA methylase N-4/N-6 domain-containing protein n=1 Tax=Marseillevirus sp. TaxID=2809551 RepID=A0AA96EM57_9VIRU|nr:hypothetical protein MarFTMF_037 [Marseillevirus sp.]